LQDRELEDREVVALDDFFAGAGGNGLGEKFSGFGEEREHFEFVEKALRRFEVHENADAVGKFVERIHAEGQLHASFGAELVDENLGAGMVFYVLKKKSGSSGFSGFRFADAVGYFGDFQNGVDLGLDAFEFAGAVEGGDPLAKVIERQGGSPGNERL
jgi:hypothetical protein